MRATAQLALILFSQLAPPVLLAATAQGADIRATIEAANGRLAAALAKGDAAQLAGCYTADGQVFPPGSDAARGRDAIQKVWQGVVDAGIKDVALTTVEVDGHGDMAHEIGTYTLTTKDGKVADRGKYIVIWKKDKGQWRLHRDIWNSSVPVPAAKPVGPGLPAGAVRPGPATTPVPPR